MPNIKSATKRMELSRKWREANRKKRSTLRTAIRKVENAADAESAREHFQLARKLIDRASTKRLMHPNKAARIKSRLERHIAGL